MRVVITGLVSGYRLVDLKGTGRVGQFDLLQAGDDKHASKVVSLYIPGNANVRLVLEAMTDGARPIVSVMAWLTFNREIEIEVMEILSLSVPARSEAEQHDRIGSPEQNL